VALRLLAAVVSALFLCGCEVYAVPNPITCPDVRQGTFNFVGQQILSPDDCFFAQPGNPYYQVSPSRTFAATISFVPGGDKAVLCVAAAHAVPNLGTRSELTIDVASVFALPVNGCTCPSAAAATASSCGCPASTPTSNCQCLVLHEQRIQGTLQAIPGGYSGFDGVLVNTVEPPPGLDPAQLCNCQKTCTYSYDLAATAVGSR
jgi:hypothetical protein